MAPAARMVAMAPAESAGLAESADQVGCADGRREAHRVAVPQDPNPRSPGKMESSLTPGSNRTILPAARWRAVTG